jgi:hypothetical protein
MGRLRRARKLARDVDADDVVAGRDQRLEDGQEVADRRCDVVGSESAERRRAKNAPRSTMSASRVCVSPSLT